MTLDAFINKYPEITVIPAQSPRMTGGKWLHGLTAAARRDLSAVEDFTLAPGFQQTNSELLMHPKKRSTPTARKDYGRTSVAAMDLPRTLESVQTSADKLLPEASAVPGGAVTSGANDLLQEVLYALNDIPRTPLRSEVYEDTYKLAAAIQSYLRSAQ